MAFLNIVAYGLLIIALALMFCVYLVHPLRKKFNYQVKLNSKELNNLAQLKPEDQVKYRELLQDLKLKKYCLLAAALVGALSWVAFYFVKTWS